MLRRVTRCDLFSLGYVLFAWEEHMQLLKTFGGKGQLISEWLFGVFNFPKKTTQKFDEFLP